MSVEAVLYKIRQNQKVSLVDVCSREDFERLHIPGSVNIVLHAVKTKNYLKLTPVVLVNEGFRYAELENERRRLLERGFQVSVLDGGLSAWYRKGGKLVGDLFALDAMKSVSPRVFFREKGYKNTLAVDISPTRSEASSRLVPYAQHINALGDKDDLAEEIKTLLHKNKTGPFRSIIIFNENGRQLQTLRRET